MSWPYSHRGHHQVFGKMLFTKKNTVLCFIKLCSHQTKKLTVCASWFHASTPIDIILVFGPIYPSIHPSRFYCCSQMCVRLWKSLCKMKGWMLMCEWKFRWSVCVLVCAQCVTRYCLPVRQTVTAHTSVRTHASNYTL